MTTSVVRNRPLVVTGDAQLLDDLVRLGAVAGVELTVAPDPVAARARFPDAPLVLVGYDTVEQCARARFTHRAGVVLVGFSTLTGLDSSVWELAAQIGAEHVALLPDAESWLREQITRHTIEPTATGSTAQSGRVVAFVGGRGGAGASVLAAGLAVTAARKGLRVLLVDADPLGGGADLALGWESLGGLRWPALADASGRVDPPALVAALPRRGELAVLSWDRGDLFGVPADAMAATLSAGGQDRDLVVVDLPRRLDEAAVLGLRAADRSLLVVPAELRACAAAARVAVAVAAHGCRLEVIVRGPAPGGLKAREIARTLGLPLAGVLRSEAGLAKALERGEPPAAKGGPMALLCQRILADLQLTDPRLAA